MCRMLNTPDRTPIYFVHLFRMSIVYRLDSYCVHFSLNCSCYWLLKNRNTRLYNVNKCLLFFFLVKRMVSLLLQGFYYFYFVFCSWCQSIGLWWKEDTLSGLKATRKTLRSFRTSLSSRPVPWLFLPFFLFFGTVSGLGLAVPSPPPPKVITDFALLWSVLLHSSDG